MENKTLQEQIAAKKAELESKEAKETITKEPEVEKKETKKPTVSVKKSKIVLFNTSGKEVSAEDYFYKGTIPSGFEGTCGKPVDREDLLAVFNKVFKPEDNILFYRQIDKEVYLVIIPLKYSVAVGDSEDSLEGDFQKHAISFLNEGSVNLDTLRQKLEKVTNFVKYTDR